MTPEPRAFVAVDLGTATTAVSVIGRIDGAWRLIGGTALPRSVPLEAIVDLVARRLHAADPVTATRIAADPSLGEDPDAFAEAAASWPRVTVETSRPPRLAVVAATERVLERLLRVARAAGWDATGVSVANADALAVTRLLLRPDVAGVLAGTADPIGGDERSAVPDLAAVVAAAVERRPALHVVLAGGFAEHEGRIVGAMRRAADAAGDGDASAGGDGGSGRRAAGGPSASQAGDSATGTVLVAPAATSGDPPGDDLRRLLDELAAGADDGRRATVRAVTTLAAALDRTIESVDVGRSAGLRVHVTPGAPGSPPTVRWAVHPDGALVPQAITDDVVDGVLAWSVIPLDRHRMRDRLRELRDAPWGEPEGDGALLRLAAARAAVDRLLAATPSLEPATAPDLLIACGGAWAVAPGPAIALALSDVLRRPGASQLAYDHARLLGPLGTILDPAERRRVLSDLLDDLLAPLGGVVVPAGLRPGRSAGRLVVHGSGGSTELELVPGGLELVDLPPGESAVAELQFRDQVTLGTRGRRFALELGGGLGWLLVDLRDVPLRLPDRLDRRRELLGAWQQSLWAGIDE